MSDCVLRQGRIKMSVGIAILQVVLYGSVYGSATAKRRDGIGCLLIGQLHKFAEDIYYFRLRY